MSTEVKVPVIDVTAAIAGTGIGHVAEQIDRACQHVGFFQIVGHGVDQALLDAVHATAPAFWSLPRDVKEQYRSPTGHSFQGWYTRDDADGAALQEKWEGTTFDTPADAVAHGVPEIYAGRFRGNLWPAAAPEFVTAMQDCFVATRALGDRVMAMFAVALGLDETYFEAMLHNDSSYFAVNSYPGTSVLPPGDEALFEHTDSGTLTLLHQRGDYEGLQVRLRNGEPYRMPIIDEALVVNIGDLMARWTNDRWSATPHKVVLGESGQARASVTTFHTPAVDAVVAPVATQVGADGPHYDPVTIFDWEDQFLAKTYA